MLPRPVWYSIALHMSDIEGKRRGGGGFGRIVRWPSLFWDWLWVIFVNCMVAGVWCDTGWRCQYPAWVTSFPPFKRGAFKAPKTKSNVKKRNRGRGNVSVANGRRLD